MTEKEERIVIKKQINYHPPYGGWCGDGKEIVLTRTEAINRMAKAFFKSWYGEGFEQEDTDLKRRYRESAEAALNALLESDK